MTSSRWVIVISPRMNKRVACRAKLTRQAWVSAERTRRGSAFHPNTSAFDAVLTAGSDDKVIGACDHHFCSENRRSREVELNEVSDKIRRNGDLSTCFREILLGSSEHSLLYRSLSGGAIGQVKGDLQTVSHDSFFLTIVFRERYDLGWKTGG